MKDNAYLINLTLITLSITICFVTAEIGLRSIIYGNISFFNNIHILAKQKDPGLYADPDSEDEYWKIMIKIMKSENKKGYNTKPHPILGYIADLPKDTFLHNKTNKVSNRRPVLFYGDSFTECVQRQRCFQDFLNNDPEFSRNNYLLNYGVGGFGVDQMYILFKKSVDFYGNPFVVIGIYTKDLDRSILSFMGEMKPRFRLENDSLKLEETALNLDPFGFIQKYPPETKSYLYKRIMLNSVTRTILPKQLISYITRSDYYTNKKKMLNEKIIHELIKEIRTRNLDFIFIIFEQYNPEKSNNDAIDWRVALLKQIFEDNNISYILTREIIKRDYKDNNFSYTDYFIPNDGHPTSYLNGLVSEEIKKYVIDSSQLINNSKD